MGRPQIATPSILRAHFTDLKIALPKRLQGVSHRTWRRELPVARRTIKGQLV